MEVGRTAEELQTAQGGSVEQSSRGEIASFGKEERRKLDCASVEPSEW